MVGGGAGGADGDGGERLYGGVVRFSWGRVITEYLSSTVILYSRVLVIV